MTLPALPFFFLFSTVYKEDVGYQGAYIAFDRTLH